MTRISQFAKDLQIPYTKAKKLVDQGRSKKDNGSSIIEKVTMETKENGKKTSDFGMLSVKAGIDDNPNPTQADRIAGATNKADYGMRIKNMMMEEGGKMEFGMGGRNEYGHGGKNEYGHGGKNEYGHGGKAQGSGGDVDALLQMLANFDQERSVGDFLQMLMNQSGAGDMPSGRSMGEMNQPPMRNMPPRDAESLLRQLGQQER